MWWWILGGVVIVALIGGAVSTHYEDKLWEEFFRRVWNRITGRGRSKEIQTQEKDDQSGTADIVNSEPPPSSQA